MKWVLSLVPMVLLIFARKTDAAIHEKEAIFAGGCFWCMQPPFEHLDGVLKVEVGYTGGKKLNPTYEEVSSGKTGHLEAIKITYDPLKISYRELLEVFWRQIDPTDASGQFADKGTQYKTAIFFTDDEQRQQAEESRENLGLSGKFSKPIVTEILKATPFYRGEDYHQDFYKKNPLHYNRYKVGSGRSAFIEQQWAAPAETSKSKKTNGLKDKLSPLQYRVTQQCGTEPPFQNEFWSNKKEGIYVDIVSGEPLFSSRDKFDSGTGWPSFTQPLKKENIHEKTDNSHGMIRTEVRSSLADSHLGHLFADGPEPTGLRYCINSASLRFIPKEDLKKEGYGQYERLFE